jgi:hypothetical protein
MASKQPKQRVFCVGYNSIHSEAQDLSKADVIINHFNELDFDLVRIWILN